MRLKLRIVSLVILALAGVYTGAWGYFASHDWFAHYPGMGRVWLPIFGPFNEHLVKDTSAFFLALGVLGLFALRYVRDDMISRATGTAWLTFSVLHTIYHFQHLDMLGDLDKALNAVLLPLLTLASAALFIPVSGRRGDS